MSLPKSKKVAERRWSQMSKHETNLCLYVLSATFFLYQHFLVFKKILKRYLSPDSAQLCIINSCLVNPYIRAEISHTLLGSIILSYPQYDFRGSQLPALDLGPFSLN